MGKIVSRARQLRLEYQAKVGRPVPIHEVAEAIGVDRRVVMKIERNEMQRIDADVLQRLAAFYHEQGIDAKRIIEYDPNGIRGLELGTAVASLP